MSDTKQPSFDDENYRSNIPSTRLSRALFIQGDLAPGLIYIILTHGTTGGWRQGPSNKYRNCEHASRQPSPLGSQRRRIPLKSPGSFDIGILETTKRNTKNPSHEQTSFEKYQPLHHVYKRRSEVRVSFCFALEHDALFCCTVVVSNAVNIIGGVVFLDRTAGAPRNGLCGI